MHPRHRVLLKKNAKMIEADRNRAFYFVADKESDSQILHIDRKIRQPTKFSTVKKVNRTLEAFDDDEYQVGRKSRMCAGTVTRDQKGLIFSVDIKRGLSESQLARSLKKFKKLIGKSLVSNGDEDAIDVDAAPEDDAPEAVDLAGPLAAYAASAAETQALLSAWTEDGADADDPRLEVLSARYASEGALVDAALQAIDAHFVSSEEDASVSGRALSDWLAELEGWDDALGGQLGISEEAEVDLTAEVREALREANLSPEQLGTVEQAQASLSTWLLQQQEIFRSPDTQLDGVISGDEVFFTRDGERVVLDGDAMSALGLDQAFTLDAGGMLVVRDEILTEDGITPEGRAYIAGVLVDAVTQGFDLHLRNPSSGLDSADLDLSLDGGGVSQRTTRRGPASATNLQFDRSDELVPGTEPPVSFRDLAAGLNAAGSDEEFALLNEMMHDAYIIEVGDGKVSGEMSFLQYKMQFIDLAVPHMLESGLRWHDGTGQLNVAEWAFAQLRVKDMPETTQHNYMVEISSPYLTKKKLERTMDLGIKPPAIPTEDDIYAALARDGFWAKYANGDLVAYYKGKAKISVKLGYADPDKDWSLTWEPTTEPFYTGKVDGQDELLPLVNDLPEGTLRNLTTDVDGTTKDPRTGEALDITAEDAVEKTTGAISRAVMTAAMSTWTERSGEALGDLLKPIPDSQKVFLRQSNGTVNAIRIGNTDIRGALAELGSINGLEGAAAQLRELLTQQPLNDDAIDALCQQVQGALDSFIERVRAGDSDGDELAQYEEMYARLTKATSDISDAELTDIGQTAVITSGNDTGAFGKCAPTAYFCGAICGIAVQAHAGLETLKGAHTLTDKAADLQALITGAPMDAVQREALGEQIDAIVAQIEADHAAMKSDHIAAVQASPDWTALVARFDDQAGAVKDQLAAAIAAVESAGLDDEEAARQIAALNTDATDALQAINAAQRTDAEALYKTALRDADKNRRAQLQAVKQVRQLKTSTLDQLVVEQDDDGPFFDMRFPVPRAAMRRRGGRDGWLLDKFGSPLPDLAREHPDQFFTHPETGELHFKVKVRPGDIQEYLEETNREDKYRGRKKHMMDFFKDPSSMNNIQLMENLGPGLVAVGLDKGLKDLGKDSGLLYGPGADVVATMVYGEQKDTDYSSLKNEMPKKGTPEYEREFKRRREQLISKLKRARDDNGSIAVSMGFKSANGHVNYIQSWGTPTIDGVEISADDVARCRMNIQENPAGSSAWNNDRVQEYPINPAALLRGVTGIEKALRDAPSAKEETIVAARSLRGKAEAATQEIDAIAQSIFAQYGMLDAFKDMEPDPGTASQEKLLLLHTQQMEAYRARFKELKAQFVGEGLSEDDATAKAESEVWDELPNEKKVLINAWSELKDDPGYADYMDTLRAVSADAMAFLKGSMHLEQSDEALNNENMLIMPSNTERDNAVSDNPDDHEKVGGGMIGSQKHGSANATDASYFVPVNALASGWNGVVEGSWSDDETDCTATRYNYSDNPSDQFVMLASMTVMLDKTW